MVEKNNQAARVPEYEPVWPMFYDCPICLKLTRIDYFPQQIIFKIARCEGCGNMSAQLIPGQTGLPPKSKK